MSADTDPQDDSLDSARPETAEEIGAGLIGRFLGSPDGLGSEAEALMEEGKNETMHEYYLFYKRSEVPGVGWYAAGIALAFIFHTEIARFAGRPQAPVVEKTTFQDLSEDVDYEILQDEAEFNTGDFSRKDILHMRMLARTDSIVNGMLDALLHHQQHRSLTSVDQRKFTAGAITTDRLLRAQARKDRPGIPQ